MTRPTDRPRGILSQADRAFLLGESTLESEQSVYDTRYRIRKRIQNAILDFSLLLDHLATKDVEQAFDPPGSECEEFTNAIIDAMAFFCLGIEQHDLPRENLLAESVRRVEQRRAADRTIVSASISIECSDGDRMASILDRIEAGDVHELTDEELRAFAQLCGRGCDRPPREIFDRRFRE